MLSPRQIKLSLKRIEKCKKEGFYTEGLIKIYHLNISILRFILLKINHQKSTDGLKAKGILTELIAEVKTQPGSKTIINKKNLKITKPWLDKMDIYFRVLKLKQPSNTKTLMGESEKIFSILNFSLTKIFVTDKK